METLPNELLQLVVLQIDEMQSFYNFALSCKQVSEITQDKLVQQEMKDKFGLKTLRISSKGYFFQYSATTFTSYKVRKVFKIPKYEFSLEVTSLDEIRVEFSLTKLVENFLLDYSHQDYPFVCWSYMGT